MFVPYGNKFIKFRTKKVKYYKLSSYKIRVYGIFKDLCALKIVTIIHSHFTFYRKPIKNVILLINRLSSTSRRAESYPCTAVVNVTIAI